MNIYINKDFAQFGYSTNYFDRSIISLGNTLGVLKDGILRDDLFNKLIVNNDSVLISSFWAGKLCEDGGIKKPEFIDLQVFIFELRELYLLGKAEVNFYVNGNLLYPNVDSYIPKEDKTTKQMIKKYKVMYPRSMKGCPHYNFVTKDYYSKLCCICGNKDILLLRREK